MILVLDTDGNPVSIDEDSTVELHYHINRFGTAGPLFARLNWELRPGFHMFSIWPGENGTGRWNVGHYLISVVVKVGAESGRTLLDLDVPSEARSKRLDPDSKVRLEP